MMDEYAEDELSEEPVIRRSSKFLKRAPATDPYFEMEVEDEYHINTKKFSWNGGRNQSAFTENQLSQNKGKYKRESIKIK